ncbi:MAG: lipoprotein [Desulfohalobiaceae bacterium]|nr:lipoprotein [Desulfohalobiaceae bacterium]
MDTASILSGCGQKTPLQ